MEIIDRYVAEVGRNLPEKSRPDITREIRSLLEDALEDRSQKAGRAPDEEMAVALLKEFGAPQKVAASYLPPRYLVGPQLYPTFITVLKVILTIVVVVMLIQFGVALTRTGRDLVEFGRVFLELLGNLTRGFVQALGTLVIVFTIIQWTSPDMKAPAVDWDPRKLKPVDANEKPVKTVDLALEMVFTVIVILLFNLYIDKVGMYIFDNNNWQFLPVLTQAFYIYIPALTALWVLTVVKDLWVLRENRWTTTSLLYSAGLNVFTMGIAFTMLVGAPIVALGPEALTGLGSLGMNASTVQALETGVTLSVRLVLAIALIGTGVELIKTLYQLVVRRSSAVV